MTQNEFGSNTPKMSISQNILNCGRIMNVKRNLIIIVSINIKNWRNFRNITKKTKHIFLVARFKKLWQKIVVPRNS